MGRSAKKGSEGGARGWEREALACSVDYALMMFDVDIDHVDDVDVDRSGICSGIAVLVFFFFFCLLSVLLLPCIAPTRRDAVSSDRRSRNAKMVLFGVEMTRPIPRCYPAHQFHSRY